MRVRVDWDGVEGWGEAVKFFLFFGCCFFKSTKQVLGMTAPPPSPTVPLPPRPPPHPAALPPFICLNTTWQKQLGMQIFGKVSSGIYVAYARHFDEIHKMRADNLCGQFRVEIPFVCCSLKAVCAEMSNLSVMLCQCFKKIAFKKNKKTLWMIWLHARERPPAGKGR